jgi:hypothetical protein
MAMTLGFSAKELKHADTTSRKEGVSAMKCVRCGGLLVAEPCTDFWEDVKNLAVRRCVQCGELVDQVILQNRHRGPTGVLPTSRRSSVVSRSEQRI